MRQLYSPFNALVYVGDAMEENIDILCGRAAEAGMPVFIFQEGDHPDVEHAFRDIARVSKGAYCRFDARSADMLRELLAAVAVYATSGTQGLEAHVQNAAVDAPARLLMTQLKR
jgi:hypothetical protein